MEVSDKLATEFNIIILSHALMLVLLVSFSSYILFRAKKTPLLFSYLCVVSMISIWMISKILKTISPSIELRWFIIVMQYFAIDALGVCLLVFANIYTRDRFPSRKLLTAWMVIPTVSFFVLLTNPLHMTFYSYFDIYRDRFGPAFYVAQSVQYIYLIAGILMLSRGFAKQPGFHSRKEFGRFFGVLVLLPLLINLYYILFKMDLFAWILPFPVFDFTAITASISLMLFMIPALAFRFFDMSPISMGRLYDTIPEGIVFVDQNHRIYGGNKTFFAMLQVNDLSDIRKKADPRPTTLTQLLNRATALNAEGKALLLALIADKNCSEVEIQLNDGRCLYITKTQIKSRNWELCVSDRTEINRNRQQLYKQNLELAEINRRLDELAKSASELAVARTKSLLAQHIHDILGHSLTVVIGTAELAAVESKQNARRKLDQIEELLTSSLNDIRNALSGKGMQWGQTTLIKAIGYLKNENIQVDIHIHGKVYELSGEQTEAVYRLCQESVTNAIKHGKARNIHLILRYHSQDLDVYAIDNGSGCAAIQESFGLRGIRERLARLSGSVSYSSDGESGFTVHGKLPRVTETV